METSTSPKHARVRPRAQPARRQPEFDPRQFGAEAAERVDRHVARWLEERPLPGDLVEAIRYSLLAPGKRIRPTLVLRSCAAVGGDAEDALAAAGGIEMVHAFSLIHDDLPAMDDDDLRRGRPTLHRHTSEAMAILAGDALMGLAFELVIRGLEPAELAASICRELALGCNDMIAGQVYDTLPNRADSLSAARRLEMIHRHKTGALIRAACRMGARCGGAGEQQLAALSTYGEAVGLMFQAVDDLLDVTQTTEHLGKTAGKDDTQDKLTYPAVFGIDGTRREVERLRGSAIEALSGLDYKAEPLRQFCDYLAVRTQ